MIEKMRGFFDEVAQETKKVTWSTRAELRESTLVVIVSVFIVSMVIGVIDLLFTHLLKLII